MKANELMIADWVIFHDSGYASDGTTWEENRVCQIDSIDEVVRVEWYDESGCKEDWPHVSTVLLSPIPLTPEILEKNGFVESPHYPMVFRIIEDNLRVAINMDRGLYLSITKTFDDGSEEFNYNTPKPKFVHELQHALKLCGIEKEIIL